MPKKFLLISVLIFLSYSLICQVFTDFSKKLLEKKDIPESGFEQSVANIKWVGWAESDTILAYNSWLNYNKGLLTQNSSPLFKVHYFMEMAMANQALNDKELAYQNIDSALSYVDVLKYPDSYYLILNYGVSIASENRDGTTRIRYLEQVIDSKVLDHNLAKKGDILLNLSSTLENMHRYMESSRYCRQAMKIFQETADNAKMIKVLKIMFNNAYHTTEDNSNWEYLYQANDIAQRSGDSSLLADVYSSFGLAHYRNGDQLEAVRYYKMARALISDKGSYTELWAATYQHLSYTILDSLESACKLSKYLLVQCLKNNSPILSNAYRGRAWCFAKRGQVDSASYYLQASAQERESGEKADASPGYYYYMYEIAMIIKDYELALKYLETSLRQFRKYNRESAAKKLTAIRAQFDYDLQKERIKKLRLANQLENEKASRQRIIILSIALTLLTAFIFLFLLRKQLKNLNSAYKILVKKNIDLDKANATLKELEMKKPKRHNGHVIRDEEKIYHKLKILFEEDKVFKQQDLSESKLADLLETNNSYLSSIINHRFEVPFKTLLNKFRIDEARRMLVSEEFSNYSIEGIANEVGYNSRSAFYQVFKQNAGMTPSDYVKSFKEIDNHQS